MTTLSTGARSLSGVGSGCAGDVTEPAFYQRGSRESTTAAESSSHVDVEER